jgi:hypothetical protein
MSHTQCAEGVSGHPSDRSVGEYTSTSTTVYWIWASDSVNGLSVFGIAIGAREEGGDRRSKYHDSPQFLHIREGGETRVDI